MAYSKVKDLSEYRDWVRYHMRELGLPDGEISNIINSSEGKDIIKQAYDVDRTIHPSSCVDDILRDAPDHILDYIN